MLSDTPSCAWSTEKSTKLYSLEGWGCGFFEVAASGDVTVQLDEDHARVSLHEITRELCETTSLKPPFIFRIPQILGQRIRRLHQAFTDAINTNGYRGRYRSLYPIKVNHQKDALDEVIRSFQSYRSGLEVGSKTELIAALGTVRANTHIVLNGYKDAEFIDLALGAQAAGHRICIVLETPDEIELILARAKRLEELPDLGVRVRISGRSDGRWNKTNEIFGLTPAEIISVIDRLRSRFLLHRLTMLHYHHGSQLGNIGEIRAAAIEAGCVYTALVKEGAGLVSLNVGGGLGVDYDGSGSASDGSKNYSQETYAETIVGTLRKIFDADSIPHPEILTESGRAISAPHSLVVFNLHSISPYVSQTPVGIAPSEVSKELGDLFDEVTTSNQDLIADKLAQLREKIDTQFLSGRLTLREKASAESRLQIATRKLVESYSDAIDLGVHEMLYANLSVFQAVPDHWAIGQRFPMMPLQKLDTRPDVLAKLSDLTCDSDGTLRASLPQFEGSDSLPVHHTDDPAGYYLGVFLTGAYQEALGTSHNLFGKLHTIKILLTENGAKTELVSLGQSNAEVLTEIGYTRSELIENYKAHLTDHAKAHGGESQIVKRLNSFVSALGSYSYPSIEPQSDSGCLEHDEVMNQDFRDHALGG